MKHHVMISLGLLMAAIFGFRLANSLLALEFGFHELYLLGGLGIAGWLIMGGLNERRASKSSRKQNFRD